MNWHFFFWIVYKTIMASYKIQKANGAAPADETELAVAQALVDLESSVPELRALAISSAKEVIIWFLMGKIEQNNNFILGRTRCW